MHACIEAEHEGDDGEVDHVDEYFGTMPTHYSEKSWDEFEEKFTREFILPQIKKREAEAKKREGNSRVKQRTT